ncbi:MAG: AraC family transcriptional regulator [Verrucomicrobiota bacterium]|nr:AraC family transcriptional regulator [Verrucomicrobiota bacterium]
MKRQPDKLFVQRMQNPFKSIIGRISWTGYLPENVGVSRQSMRTLGSYAIVYVISGEGEYHDGLGAAIKIQKGDLFFVLPNVSHAYGPELGKTWEELYLVFDGPVFDLWAKAGFFSRDRPKVHLEPIDHWVKRLSSIVRQSVPDSMEESLEEVARLQLVLAEVASVFQTHSRPRTDHEWLLRAKSLIEEKSRSTGEYAFVARDLGMSHESFRKKFKKLSGFSPGKYHILRVIDRACHMIYNGKGSKEIAATLQFCDEFHFSKTFSKVIGQSPSQFRKNLPS